MTVQPIWILVFDGKNRIETDLIIFQKLKFGFPGMNDLLPFDFWIHVILTVIFYIAFDNVVLKALSAAFLFFFKILLHDVKFITLHILISGMIKP